ncbi:hypothetical protein FHS83_002255 [Rhizomicrobium palustre]|uniref:Uncharacterized protein n=1 Tax=Rhizomicrobium palustre TaxID=189966 RepID=A0A846N198_9PROT|nr:hypothetical protein [Rhizomicrobium palustre]NIK88937.1 hypothetical protein [Rhizomicrobium palustre]
MAQNGLYSTEDTAELIRQGRTLLLAGDEILLTQLPEGNWIGGTTASFMTEDGGVTDKEHIFVTDLSDVAEKAVLSRYKITEIPHIARDYPRSGFTVLIVPGGSEIHASFAKGVPFYEDVFASPLLGWVSGVEISEMETRRPMVFAGRASPLLNEAVALHVSLPKGKLAHLQTINLFSPSDGDVIVFQQDGFVCDDQCRIDGKLENFASYLTAQHIDPTRPLMASHNGALVNVSIRSIDADLATVQFYAPVFAGVEYRFANPIENYTKTFEQYMELEQYIQNAGACVIAFSCNCLLNYLSANLEGKKTGPFVGPMTYGEIAYILLNQTLVYLKVSDSV